MNNFTYENQGSNTYLVYQVINDADLDTMSLGMLTNNTISGFAPVTFTQIDNVKYIKYNVSSKVSVDQFFTGPVNKKRLLGVFGGVVDAILSAQDYMIDEASIIMDTKYMFANVSTCQTVLICLPLSCAASPKTDLKDFFRNIMFTTQFDQTENCDHVAKIINYLNSGTGFSVSDFKDLLDSISGNVKATPAAMASASVSKPTPIPVPAPVPQPNPIPVPAPIPQPNPIPAPAPIPQPKPIPASAPIMQPRPIANPAPVPVPAPNVRPNQMPKPVSSSEKKMSLIYLLRHYSKENSDIYKRQKAEQKAVEDAAKGMQKKKSPVMSQSSFVVPPAPNSMPIPPARNPMPVPPARNPMPAPPARNPMPVPPAPNPMPVPPAPNPMPVPPASNPMPVPPAPNPMPVSPAANQYPINNTPNDIINGTTDLLRYNELNENTATTSLLSRQNTPVAPPKPYLIRVKNGEKIMLNKPIFKIGKERSYVDYFVSDNTAVSRSHATLFVRNDGVYIVDTNSTNHTYVNGTMISSNVEVKLENGVLVRLADEDFNFYAH